MDHSKVLFILNDKPWFECATLQKIKTSMHVTVSHFQNGELSIHLEANVADKDVVVVKRFSANLHEDIFELLQCIDILNRKGAKTITLLLPYYPYARQDHNANWESQNALLLARLLADLGVSKIITMDMHAPEQLCNFPLKVVNLTLEHFWVNHLRTLGYDCNEIQIMAADKSAMIRAQQIAFELDCSWGYVNKQRNKNGEVQILEVSSFSNKKRTFLIDDLMDTGRTIIAGTQALRRLSSQPITVCVTHCHATSALFTSLFSVGLSQLFTTDTLKSVAQIQPTKVDFVALEIFSMLYAEISRDYLA